MDHFCYRHVDVKETMMRIRQSFRCFTAVLIFVAGCSLPPEAESPDASTPVDSSRWEAVDTRTTVLPSSSTPVASREWKVIEETTIVNEIRQTQKIGYLYRQVFEGHTPVETVLDLRHDRVGIVGANGDTHLIGKDGSTTLVGQFTRIEAIQKLLNARGEITVVDEHLLVAPEK